MKTKTFTITSDGKKITTINEGFEHFELLGVLYFLEQDIKVKTLMHNRDEES